MESCFILYVADQARSKAFYEQVLGAPPRLHVPGMTEFDLPSGGTLGLMPESGIRGLLGSRLPDPALGRGIPRAELYLVVDEPGPFHARALEAGAVELSSLQARDWGHLVAYSQDPDGHVLAWARPVAGGQSSTPAGAPSAAKGRPRTTPGFVASHAEDARFERGLRSFCEYRDLGIKDATEGRVGAHVIRAAAGKAFSSRPHLHETTFQMVYVLRGWIEFEYEGQGRVRLEAGSCVHQRPGIRHRELGHSNDIEMLEIVMPAAFPTMEVDSIQP